MRGWPAWIVMIVVFAIEAVVVWRLEVTPADAQTAFAPYQIDQIRDGQLRSYLDKQPYAVAAPIIQALDTWEADARGRASDLAKAAEKAKKPAPNPAPPETAADPSKTKRRQ